MTIPASAEPVDQARPSLGPATTVIEAEERRRLSLVQMSLLALALGVVTGVGAWLFRDLIGLIHNTFFTGHAVIAYDANLFTAPAPWGPLVILGRRTAGGAADDPPAAGEVGAAPLGPESKGIQYGGDSRFGHVAERRQRDSGDV